MANCHNSNGSGTSTGEYIPALEKNHIQQIKEEYNLIDLQNASEIGPASDEFFAGRSFKIAVTGYSAPPPATYEEITTKFLSALITELGKDKVGLITSPTADKGSIDAISTGVAQEQKVPILYITAESYIIYIKPDNFPDTIDKEAYKNAPKYVFPTESEYSKATSEASDYLLITGGRNAAVNDVVNGIEKGNKIVVLDNLLIGGVNWDEENNKPNNGARYIVEQLEAFRAGKSLPHPECRKFTLRFLKKHASRLDELIKVVKVSTEADILSAVKETSDYFKGKL